MGNTIITMIAYQVDESDTPRRPVKRDQEQTTDGAYEFRRPKGYRFAYATTESAPRLPLTSSISS